MLSIIGLLTILTIILLLLWGKITPIIGLVVIPIIGALLAGFGFVEIADFYEQGIVKVMSVVIMFIFAILYFGVMQDVGLFDPIINKMIKVSGANVVAITTGTVIIASIAHLDGSGASTFLITIPALLPLYKRLRMSPYLLLLLVGLSASIVNMVPWGGPLGRVGAILGKDPSVLWRPLIPVQIVGLVLAVAMAYVLGVREKIRISRLGPADEEIIDTVEEVKEQEQNPIKHAHSDLLWANFLLTAGTVGILLWGVIPAGFTFMMALSIALPLNFRKVEKQMERIKAHAPNALLMAAIILAAGSFLGILGGTGMLNSLAVDMVKFLPDMIITKLHLVIGFLGVPFEIILNTDAYYFALFPVIEQIVTSNGVDSLSATYAMVIGNIIGTFISPFSPALWLALGLAGCNMGNHIRYSFFWMWGFSIVLMIIAALIGTF
ncbi:MAG: citrate:proton symporter [Cyclobacteriaceae bacterium]